MLQLTYHFSLLLTLLGLAGCAKPYVQPASANLTTPALLETYAIMEDGYRLPLSFWHARGEPQALLLALHGLNDYRQAFASASEYLVRRGINVIAYDQRGFGNSDGRGLWHGTERLAADLHTLIRLLGAKYPKQPLYLLGESMGGAVVLAAMHREPLRTDGIILLAPAIWSRASMPIYQRAALWLMAHLMPSLELTGKGLDLQPSDNIEMLRALSRDPLVIKATRVDVLYGMSNLMDRAVSTSDNLPGRLLILYGSHDEIIPRDPVCQWLDSLPPDNSQLRQTLVYANGYHMLTRDLQALVVLEDIADWVIGETGPSNRVETLTLDAFCS
jgi:alpha-beta hydrolase superfamily lysophospholipase